MNAREYYLNLQSVIHTASHVQSSDVRFEEIDSHECYIKGVLVLINGFELHIAEYVITEPTLMRLKYRYHLQTADGQLISRWDNVPHHPSLSTFPDHRHDYQNLVHPSPQMNIADVLNVALHYITPMLPEQEKDVPPSHV